MKTSVLSDRTMSTWSLSIGTSLAMESIQMGSRPPYVAQDGSTHLSKHIDISDYDEIWINLLTLHRNMISSVDRKRLGELDPMEIAQELVFEMGLIEEIILGISPRIKVIFYSSSYKAAELEKRFPRAKLRYANTALQKFHNNLLGLSLTKLYTLRKNGEGAFHYPLDIECKTFPRALMLSHYAYDLIHAKQFKSLGLLESYTGELKTKALWYTKFSDKRAQRIPFNSLFIQVFGDDNVFFMHDAALRQAVLDLADEHQWNHTTSESRINLTLGFMKNQFAREYLRDMS